VTGGETDVCVLATVLGAVDYGYRSIVLGDALCSASDADHDAMLELYADATASSSRLRRLPSLSIAGRGTECPENTALLSPGVCRAALTVLAFLMLPAQNVAVVRVDKVFFGSF
jgi:hypothetical protein